MSAVTKSIEKPNEMDDIYRLIIIIGIVIFGIWIINNLSCARSNQITEYDKYEQYNQYEQFKNSNDRLTEKEIKALRSLAKSYKDGSLTLENLRLKGSLVVDGATHCKHNLTAKDIKSVTVSGNVLDGSTVKGEKINDNNNALVKRGQRIRIHNNAGSFQVWTIDNEID